MIPLPSARALLLVLPLLGAGAGCTDPGVPLPDDVRLSADFEGASLHSWRPLRGDTLEIVIRPDEGGDTGFWFAFDIEGAAGRDLVFRVDDRWSLYGDAGWAARRPVVSADGGDTWTPLEEAGMRNGVFTFRHRPGSALERVAVTLPYPWRRWTERLEALGADSRVHTEVIGRSLGGEPVHLLEIAGAPADAPLVWALARQHPGEPEGSHMLDGFLDWVLSPDPAAETLRSRARIRIVPFLNPDGVIHGNQRVNLAGLDLNRQWDDPDPALAPTIAAARARILEGAQAGDRVRIVIDFHGAPATRANHLIFNAPAALPSELVDEMDELVQAVLALAPDFTSVPPTGPQTVGGGDRARSWAWTALATHGLTIEASATDAPYGPYGEEPMTEARYRALGEAVGRAVGAVLFPGEP